MHNHVVREKSIYTVINLLSNKDPVVQSANLDNNEIQKTRDSSYYTGFLWSPIERQSQIQQDL